MKTLDDNFTDWEGETFGFGYGTGQPHTVAALKEFLRVCPSSGDYDYRVLEKELGATVAWLLINTLCRANILEYGVSPRFAWLTQQGLALKGFVDGKSLDELIALTQRDADYTPCYHDACNCGPHGYEKSGVCANPFWVR